MRVNKDVKPCPRCGSGETSWGYSYPPERGVVECHADGCEVMVVAGTEDAAIAIWNSGRWTHRVVDRDENGHSIIEEAET